MWSSPPSTRCRTLSWATRSWPPCSFGPAWTPLDADGLAAFLAAQEDLGTKWAPRFVRMTPALPVTATNKVLKRGLRAERWTCTDPVLWTPAKGEPYRLLNDAEAAELERAVADRVL